MDCRRLPVVLTRWDLPLDLSDMMMMVHVVRGDDWTQRLFIYLFEHQTLLMIFIARSRRRQTVVVMFHPDLFVERV